MKPLVLGMAAMLAVLFAFEVEARPARAWKDVELWNEAEIVVLATPQSTKDVAIAGESRPEYWIDVETTLDVQAVLKGKADDKIIFRHARYAGGVMAVPNGPSFVMLDPAKRQQFLLFLKRGKDGALEPLSGQMDAADSVRWVQPYGAIR